MHPNLYENWKRVLASRGDTVAVVDAEFAKSWTFNELEQLACEWLAANESHQLSVGQVWCLALSDRVAWLSVFLAAIKTGAVVLPMEPRDTSALCEAARQQSAAVLVEDSGVQVLAAGRARAGYFLIKLTSGTTGASKALPFTEAEMMADGAQIMRTMSISGQDQNYAILPLGHSYGLGNLVMPFFMAGVGIVMGSSPYPQVMAQELTRYSCTVLPLVPPLVKALSMVTLEKEALSKLRLVISAGSALPAKIAERFRVNTGLSVHNFYGSSETGGICFDRSGGLTLADGSVGTAMEGVELSIGEDQSIQVRSAALCHAAYPDGVCTLHDFGKLVEGGVLQLIGRHADIVKVAGRRVSLSEVEAALCAIDAVTDAYVSSRTGRSGETRCVALFSGDIEADAVRCLLKSVLPTWKIPKQLWRVDSIPYTSRGKKDRSQLEDLVRRNFS